MVNYHGRAEVRLAETYPSTSAKTFLCSPDEPTYTWKAYVGRIASVRQEIQQRIKATTDDAEKLALGDMLGILDRRTDSKASSLNHATPRNHVLPDRVGKEEFDRLVIEKEGAQDALLKLVDGNTNYAKFADFAAPQGLLTQYFTNYMTSAERNKRRRLDEDDRQRDKTDVSDEEESEDEDMDCAPRTLFGVPGYLEEAEEFRRAGVGCADVGLYARHIIDMVPRRPGEGGADRQQLSGNAERAVKEIVRMRLNKLGRWKELREDVASLLKKLKQDLLEIGGQVTRSGHDAVVNLLKDAKEIEQNVSRFQTMSGGGQSTHEDHFPKDAANVEVWYIVNMLRKSCEMIQTAGGHEHSGERDLDISYHIDVFKCIEGVLMRHYGEVESLDSRDRKIRAKKDGESTARIRGAYVDWLWTSHHYDSCSNWGVEFAAAANVGAKRSNYTKLVHDKEGLAVLLRDIYSAICGRIKADRNENVDGALDTLVIPGVLVNRFRYQILALVYISHGWYALHEIAAFEAPVSRVPELGAMLVTAVTWMLRFRKLVSNLKVDFSALRNPDVTAPAQPLDSFKVTKADRTR
ncbi:hypothetical protein HK104_001719 [Borealophlyctis nickersoniae]|nr:hypothetical protein HK104_001719 [Borealophlyctis nickersoniae]